MAGRLAGPVCGLNQSEHLVPVDTDGLNSLAPNPKHQPDGRRLSAQDKARLNDLANQESDLRRQIDAAHKVVLENYETWCKIKAQVDAVLDEIRRSGQVVDNLTPSPGQIPMGVPDSPYQFATGVIATEIARRMWMNKIAELKNDKLAPLKAQLEKAEAALSASEEVEKMLRIQFTEKERAIDRIIQDIEAR
jgi:hypothetical protein